MDGLIDGSMDVAMDGGLRRAVDGDWWLERGESGRVGNGEGRERRKGRSGVKRDWRELGESCAGGSGSGGLDRWPDGWIPRWTGGWMDGLRW